jgi:aminopeptidase N
MRDATTPDAKPLIRREDYTAPPYWIDTVDLTIDLEPAKTRVLNRMKLRRNTDLPPQPLKLDGEGLNLARVLVNGQGVSFRNETVDGEAKLVLDNLPDAFDLEIFTTCAPDKNTSLTGLYTSQGAFFTQCEAQGFRRITYFLDRPDVMAVYTVTLKADKAAYPVLLSNGNLVEQADLPEGRHLAKWHDPHRKPSYLFALVAGQLVCREQRISARSGKEHLLQVYVRPGDLDKTEHAMNSLMASVAWDEARFGLSLDLERFMIVAVGDFNMGAMENKGLNIFNTKYVLANPATATDADYDGIESVVAHEYFHNWTGNRVTCQDWFQLSLKEGLTVFRDQSFSMDMAGTDSARAVRRIDDVRTLRAAQFPEDAGPMAHPVRPDSYQEINNFYTATVYDKGAEVVRMMEALVARDQDPYGRGGFAKGMSLYFERHDGHAVTCDDFAQAIADANPGSALAQQLEGFKRWYSQAGTPRLTVEATHDVATQTLQVQLRQRCEPTPGQATKLPFVLPVRLGVVQPDGRNSHEQLLVLSDEQTHLTLADVPAGSVLSVLRGFSAPVIVEQALDDEALLTQLRHDADAFNRWEAAQKLSLSRALRWVTSGEDVALDAPFVDAMRSVLGDNQLDAAFKAQVLTLPSESYISEQLPSVDPQRIHAVREAMRGQLAHSLSSEWQTAFAANQTPGEYRTDPVSVGKRTLANLALANIVMVAKAQGDAVWPGKAYQRFKDAAHMTDRVGALNALLLARHPLAAEALGRFHALFRQEALVIDKWFALQAGAPDVGGDVLPKVRSLMLHPDFSLKNPNRARSLIFAFCSANPGAFHRADAAGYVFWQEQVLALDAINPQVAARLARAMDRWKKLTEPYRSAAREAISRVAAKPDLSNDVREVVSRALAD